MLGELSSSLLQDLSKSLFKNERVLNRKECLLNGLSNEVTNLNQEYKDKVDELNLVQASLAYEIEKSQNLIVQVNKIEKDLQIVVSQKEIWKNKVFEFSKVCSFLQNMFSENCNSLPLQFDELSDDLCLCKDCLNQETEKVEDSKKHTCFSPVALIHLIAKIFTSKSNCEKKICKLNERDLSLKEEIAEVENEKLTLKKNICDLEETINMRENELGTLKSNYACLESKYQNWKSLLLETDVLKEDEEDSLKTNLEDLNKCKSQYKELILENEKAKYELAQKKDKIIYCEKTIEEKSSLCESLSIKCKEYERKVENLDSSLFNMTSSLNEAKKKVTTLQEANNLLNITLENVEEELQTVCTERQKVEEMLQEKFGIIESLNQQIAFCKNEASGKINELSGLELTIKELRDSIKETKEMYSESQNKNVKLQNDISLLKKAKNDCELSLHEKNFCIKEKDLIITQLKENISLSNDEKKLFEMELAECKANLNNELQVKLTLLNDQKVKFDTILKEKEDLQKEIEHLSALKNDTSKVLQDADEDRQKCEEFLSENKLLKLELESLMLEKSDIESNLKALQNINIIERGEINKADQLKEMYNHEKNNFKKELGILKKEISLKEKTNLENFFLIQELQKKIEELKKEISKNTQSTKHKVDELALENDSLLTELKHCKTRSNLECVCKTNSVIPGSVEKSKNLIELITKFMNLLIGLVECLECSPDRDREKRNVLFILSELKTTEDSNYFTNEVQKDLLDFLTYQLSRQKELELKLFNFTKTVGTFLLDINQHFESADIKLAPDLDCTLLADKTCIDNNFLASCGESVSNCTLINITDEMQKCLKFLQLHLSSAKCILLEKDMKIKSLQESLDNQTHSQSSEDKKQVSGCSKCKLLLTNARRIESKHQKLIQTCQEMEAEKQKLKVENHELEKEANELNEKLKEQSSSEELVETYKMLTKCTQENLTLKRENDYLKATLKTSHEKSVNIA